MIYLKYKFYIPKGDLAKELIVSYKTQEEINQQSVSNFIFKEIARDFFGDKDLTNPIIEDYINHYTYTVARCDKEGKTLYRHIIIKTPRGDEETYYLPIRIDGSTLYGTEECLFKASIKYYGWADNNYLSRESFQKDCFVELDEVIGRDE